MPDLARRAGRLVGHAAAFELSLYRSLGRWLTRRPSLGGPDEEPVGYSQVVGPMLWLWILGSAVEVVVVDVLLPWDSLRVPLLVVGLWGLVWMLGMLASLRSYPHLLGPEAIRVRNGPRLDLRIPYEEIARVRLEDTDLPSSVWTVQPLSTDTGTALRIGVSGRVNVHLLLARPRTVRLPGGRVLHDVASVGLLCDDPRALVRRLRERLPA